MKDTEIFQLISSVRNRANEFIVDNLQKAGIENIAPSHGHILHNLYIKDGITMTEITQKIHKKKNTVTVLVDKLIRYGYIRKQTDDADRRTTRIFLTEKGRSIEAPYHNISKTLLETAYGNFDAEDKRTLIALLEKMLQNFL